MIYVPVLVFLGITALANVYADVPFAFFSRDPVRLLNGHPLTGIQSHLGVLLWSATAGICFFTYLALKPARVTFASFLLWSGMVTLWLALDDLFLFHEDLARRFFGIPQKAVYLAYLLFFACYVIRFREVIFRSDFVFAILAAVFLASSVAIDVLEHLWKSPWRIFFEDGFKLLGLVSWSGYLILTCLQTMRDAAKAE